MNAVYQEPGPCPCRLLNCVVGTKLTKVGHLKGCICRPCLGRRNRRKGQAGQARGHRALGGVGFTPSHEESTGGYPIRVQVEHKTGAQVPASFRKFAETEWFRHALRQAEMACRVGDGAMPSVMIDGRWLVVDCKTKEGAA